MPSARHAALAAIALVLWNPTHAARAGDVTDGPLTAAVSAWPTENAIWDIVVKPGLDGDWLLDFDYAFVGKPFALLRIDLIPKPGIDVSGFQGVQLRSYAVIAGRHHTSTVLQYPGEGTSVQVVVSMVRDTPDYPVLASQHIDKIIQWPAKDEKDFRYAVDAINNGNAESLREARQILERLIGKNPNYEPGYVELARIAMKSNWGPEGLHQAETLLDSALKINPGSANAKILLGYVYTHQRRFGEAEALFVDAARSNPVNTWLWTNWGEMFEMQGKADQAIARYREALARPVQSTQYYDARNNAYAFLVKLLEERKDVEGMEVLYKQRLAEFGPSSCYSADYAKFKLYVRGDAQGAIALARGALELNCDDTPSRQILGLASYMQWAQEAGPSSNEALNQARIYLPTGPMALYLLADNDKTMVAVKKLVASGEPIDQKDNEKMTALAHALQNRKPEAAERLLRAGARPETPVGYTDMPVALLPVMSGDVDAIRVLQRAGVDYSKLRYQGATALDYAKQIGDEALLNVLKHKERAL